MKRGVGASLCDDLAEKRQEERQISWEAGNWNADDAKEQAWQKWRTDHQTDFPGFYNDLTESLDKLRRTRARQNILKSLYFTQIRDRHDQIAVKHSQTLKWVLDDSKPDESDFDNFARWLASSTQDKNLYWISGKPGSGKSTLMRFLSDADETKSAIKAWSESRRVLKASAFFWLGGSDMQKSLKGLLQSLLFDILSQDTDGIPEVAQWRWRACLLGLEKLPEWTLAELHLAFQLLLDRIEQSCLLFLLIDGLDEYAGSFDDQTDFVKLLKNVGARKGVKVCVSSRSWPVFQSGFQGYPGLRLEKVTVADIKNYVDAELTGPSDLQATETEHDTLKAEIIARAEGVFLWVSLVVRNLRQGLVEGDTMGQLMARLREIPSDLDEFFQKIIQGIPESHRGRAMLYFRVMLASRDRPTLLDLFFLEEDESTPMENMPVAPQHAGNIEARKRAAKRRLDSRCMGLLETRTFDEGQAACSQLSMEKGRGLWTNAYVDYLHRTVRDFLMGEVSQRILNEFSPDDFDIHNFLCRASLAQMKMIDPSDKDLVPVAMSFLRYAHEHEVVTNTAHPNLVDEFFRLLNRHMSKITDMRSQHRSVCGDVSIALYTQLEHYAVLRIQDSTLDPRAKCSHPFLRSASKTASSVSLLGCCLLPRSTLYDNSGDLFGAAILAVFDRSRLDQDQPSSSSCPEEGPMNDAIRTLLAKGADPNEPFGQRTLWEHFLARVHGFSPRASLSNHSCTPEAFACWADAAKMLIEAGASQTGEDPRHPPKYRLSTAAGLTRRYNASPTDLAGAVEDIFRDHGGAEMAHVMRNRRARFRLPWRRGTT